MPPKSTAVIDRPSPSRARADAVLQRTLEETRKLEGAQTATALRRQIAGYDAIIGQLYGGDPCSRQGGARGWKAQLERYLLARNTAARRLTLLEAGADKLPEGDVESAGSAEIISRFLAGHGPAAVVKLYEMADVAERHIANDLGHKQQELAQQVQVVTRAQPHMAGNIWESELKIRTIVAEERELLDRIGRLRAAHAALPGLLGLKTTAAIEAAGDVEALARKLAESAHVPSTGQGADPVLRELEAQRTAALQQVEMLEVTAARTGQDLSEQISNVRASLLAPLDEREQDRRDQKTREAGGAFDAKVCQVEAALRKGCEASPSAWLAMVGMVARVPGPIAKSLHTTLMTAAAEALQEAGPAGLAESIDHIL